MTIPFFDSFFFSPRRLIRNIILPGCLLGFISCTDKPITFYIGEQTTDGSEFLPTIEAAITSVRRLRKQKNESEIILSISEGKYSLKQPILLTAADGPLTIKGAGDNKTYLKGSHPIPTKWVKGSGPIYVTKLPQATSTDQFIVNEKCQTLARYPNYHEFGGYWQGYAADAIDPVRTQKWQNPEGAILHVMHNGEWGDFHYQVTGRKANGEFTLSGGHQNNRPSPMHPTYRMVENIKEELDSPGEWFATHDSLYYYPPDSVSLENAKIEITTLKSLISISGTLDQPVRNITIEGIHFQHSKRTLFEEYEPLLRSDWTIYRGGAVSLQNTENITIKDCTFSQLGGNVIFVSNYNRNVSISGNHIYDCGASGICFIGNPKAVRSPSFQYYEYVPFANMDTIRGPKSKEYPADCLVENNLISRTGRIEKQTAGVQISMAAKIIVRKNSIYEVPRAGINIGDGTWGGHIIEKNDVFATVLESGDHGAFNSWGRDRFWHPNRKILDSLVAAQPDLPKLDAIYTTIIRNNRFRCDHGWDIDLDDGSSNYHIYNNLCLNGGLKLREGFNRIVNHNILINNGFHPHVWFENSGDVFKNNILFTEHKDIALSGWGKEVDYNFFVDSTDLIKSQQKGVDNNSIVGKVHFENPEKGNFNLHPDSDVIFLEFQNINFGNYGVQKPKLKAMVREPNIPQLLTNSTQSTSQTQEFLGARITEIQSIEDRSAFGLTETGGLVIKSISVNSLLAKSVLEKGDVLLQIEGETIKSLTHALKIYQGHRWKGKITIIFLRNQKIEETTLKI